MFLFLDDERVVTDVTWVDYSSVKLSNSIVIRDPYELYAILQDNITELDTLSNVVISFDHDIDWFDSSGEEVTGYDCVKKLVDMCIAESFDNEYLPTLYFHSKNPVGVNNMKSYWENYLEFNKN